MHRSQKALIAITIAIFLWIGSFNLPTGNAVISDPSATLITAESLIQHGSVDLSHYPRAALKERGTYQIVGKGGGKLEDASEKDPVFYFYPPGSPISAIPAAWISNKLGINFVDFNNEILVQRFLSSLIFGSNFLIMVLTGSSICGFLPALVLALAWSFGSSLVSTGLSALWSHDFATFYALLAITTLHRLTMQQGCIKDDKPKTNAQKIEAIGVGIFSIAAFACRPGMILLAVCNLGYIASTRSIRKNALYPYILGLSAASVSFMIFSKVEYGSLLPPYYAQTLSSNTLFEAAGAFAGLLFSPGRGLFIFTPISAFYTVLCLWIWKKEGFKNWMVFSVLWPLMQILLLSRWPIWWGGHSYGPRLLMDIIPGMAFGSFFVERKINIIRWPSRISRQSLLSLLLGFVIFLSALVHFSSLFGSSATWKSQWNSDPNINSCTELIWNWKYPQFLHDQIRHHQRLLEFKNGRYRCFDQISH
jgi:hypothetical protein